MTVEAGGKPSKGTPADKRLKKNQAKITKATVVVNAPSIRQQLCPPFGDDKPNG